jgi:ferric-dicitrate binding protein FerR (iron transport regulator)
MSLKTSIRSLVTLSLVLAIFWTYSTPGLATQQTTASIAVVGDVTVNGTRTASGTTIFSDSTITTAKGSSAVVSLGKLGRVEVLPQSTVKLTFDDSGVTCMLGAGRVRVSTSSGFNGSVNTKDGAASADNAQGNSFTVDVQCGNTIVSTQSGRVELRAGSTVKQIAAGRQDSAGQATTGSGCGAGPGAQNHVGAATIAGILLAAGGVIATAILLGNDDEAEMFGGVDDGCFVSCSR